MNLTPQEAANQGENIHLCSYEDWGEDTFSYQIRFSENSITFVGSELSRRYTGTKISPNRYLIEGDTITFTDDGFLAENDTGALICLRQ